MQGITQTRRERLREATRDEIKAAARQQMKAEGSAAISLRAIARDLGMTAPALYRYYNSRDDLITALIVDAYTSQADWLERACALLPAGDHAGRLLMFVLAYREWSLACDNTGACHAFGVMHGDYDGGLPQIHSNCNLATAPVYDLDANAHIWNFFMAHPMP